MLLSKKRPFNDTTNTNKDQPVSKKRKLNQIHQPEDIDSFLDDEEVEDEQQEIEQTQNDASSKDNPSSTPSKTNSDSNHHSDDDDDDDDKSSDNDLSDLPLSSDSWESLDLHENTLLALYNQGFNKMMKIQQLSIPYILEGDNLVGSARTGSGKTLSFMIPTIELMIDNEWDYRSDGVGALIIAPTRELAMQIFNVGRNLCEFHPSLSMGLLIGGNPRHSDIIHICKGMTICIATPGRLLDHLQRTKEFNCKNVKIFVLDEADRILDEGYEKEIQQILKFLPKQNRQTILFSATQTKKTKDLIRLSFSSKPRFVDDGSCIDYTQLLKKKKKGDKTGNNVIPTRECLVQGYILVNSHQKFLLLFSFLKKHYRNKKIMVFFSTVNVTKYFVQLLNYIDIKVYGLYGAMSQTERTKTFNSFIDSKCGVLLATNVAARGLDIPNIDWIIQYDPPNDIKNYIHRVGRTNRGLNEKNGKALLFLIPQELKYLNVLNKYNIKVKQYDTPNKKKIANIQSQLEKITNSVYHLHVSAHQAYQAYIREYGLRNSQIFDVLSLNICDIAKSFGLSGPPKMTIQIKNKSKKGKYKTVTMRRQTNKWAYNKNEGWNDLLEADS